MPWLIWGMLGALASALPIIITRLLLSIGIGYVTYVGVNSAIQTWLDYGKAHAQAWVPVEYLQFMTFLGFDMCVSILMGGVATRLALSGLTSGTRLGRITR